MNQRFLYDIYEMTRNRFNPHLTLSDYMALMDAVQDGYGIGDVSELRDLCALLWIKNENVLKDFKSYFSQTAEADLNQFLKAIKNDTSHKSGSIEEQFDNKSVPNIDSNNEVGKKDDITGKTGSDLLSNGSTEKVSTEKQTIKVQWRPDRLISDTKTAALMQNMEQLAWELSGNFILDNSYHPFSDRQLKQEWRRMRQLKVTEDSHELDIKSTVKSIAQIGIFTKPVMKKKLTNELSLTILADRKGSMLAFHSLTDQLVSTLRAEIPNARFWYYRNAPQEYFYGRLDWTKALMIENWIEKWKQKPTHLLIISDAGAARGNVDNERIKAWWNFFRKIKHPSSKIVWLNPVPKNRWTGTTAAYIAKMIDMVECDEDPKSLSHVRYLFK